MSQPRDPDAIIATWLDHGPIDLPDETRRAISVGLRTQSRVRRAAILGGSSMYPLNRFVAAAAIVLAVVGLSAFVLSNRGGGGAGSTPGPSQSTAPRPSSSSSTLQSPTAATMSTIGWIPFTASRYGYQIAHPPTWTEEPAARQWVFATDRLLTQADGMNGSADHFNGGPDGDQVGVTVFAVDVPSGTTDGQWITAYYQAEPDPNCRASLETLTSVTVDGQPGRISIDICNASQAFVFDGGRVYVVGIWRENQEPLLRGFLSTFTFPSSAPSGSPGPS
jgi:hypothetical protein